MYIWIGCALPTETERQIRTRCLACNEVLGLDTVAFSLPQHISLKISFETDAPETVLNWLERLLREEQEFYVNLMKPELAGNVLWLPAERNQTLERLHETLDRELDERFGIRQHPYDRGFLFHSTLFLAADTEKLAAMREKLAEFAPGRCLVDGFWLGVSESGKAGTYRVVKQIAAKGSFGKPETEV